MLFKDEELNENDREKIRPLGKLSDFVIEELPKLLQDQGLEKEFLRRERILLGNPDRFLRKLESLNQEELAVARLDILMLEAALRFIGCNSVTMTKIVNGLERITNRPPILTYEDIVLSNPVLDIRVFTTGKVGRHEADFYIGHNVIEQKLGHVLELLNGLRTSTIGKQVVELSVKQVHSLLDEVIELTEVIGFSMDKEAFKQFRVYIGSKMAKDNKTVLEKGPSGAFSAKVPLIDLFLKGYLSEEHSNYVKENSRYFPRIEVELLLDLISHKIEPLKDVFKRKNYDQSRIQELEMKLKQFRGMHLRAVRHQIPEIFAGQASGTAGESDVQGFLKRRINS